MSLEGRQNNVLYQVIVIRAGIMICDLGQSNILVPLQVHLDQKDSKAMLDVREKWATMGSQDLLVLRGLLDPLDLLDPRVLKVQRENGKCYIYLITLSTHKITLLKQKFSLFSLFCANKCTEILMWYVFVLLKKM